MNEEQERLWQGFELVALELWRSGGPSPNRVRNRTEVLFGIKRSPSFANPIHWQVFRRTDSSAEETHYIGVRREWNKELDRRQFESVEALTRYKYRGTIAPTLIDRTVDLRADIATPMLDLIEAHSLGLQVPATSFGCDGETTELGFGDFWAGVTLNWWGGGPDGWRPIVEQTERTFRSLEEIVGSTSAGPN